MPQEVKASYGVRIEKKGKKATVAELFCSSQPAGSFSFLSAILAKPER
jgi:hypothetical protein